jgi:tetratricopeptide (TPR) repeat protein
LVVVDASGEVFGEAPNVAARVQAAAEPGTVLITSAVQRQVAGLFVAEEQRARELKGVFSPVQLFRIIRASGGGRRGGVRALTPFVGREEELSLLTRRWERARAGEGQFVHIVGEPGLGKSRLVEEFHARLAETPHTWVEWSASQLLQNTTLHPIAEWGRQRFGADAPAEQRLADLEGTLQVIGLDPAEYAPLLAPLVDIPLPSDRAMALAPEELRRRQLAAIVAWVTAGARSQPIVLVVEDLQWADPTSLDVLRSLAERGGQVPLFLVTTSRPEFRPSWAMRSHHSVISLAPLDRAQVFQMVGELASRHALPKDVFEGVSERTGGVPLFIEEVTRLLLERGEQGGVQAIPPTLQQSLAARLDRLGPAREVAQIGAVLGRDFSYLLLRNVSELNEAALQGLLEQLADADLLFVEGAPPEASYRFKHALIQDAAYDSLLKSCRQQLHRRAAELLHNDPERAAAEPEVIAHHFTQGGLDDLAIEWWGKAGDQALRRSAFQEAIAHLGKAIEMADKTETATGNTSADAGRRKIRNEYARAVMWTKGVNADETKAAYARVEDERASAGVSNDGSAEILGRWAKHFMRGDFELAQGDAERTLDAAEREGRTKDAALSRVYLGSTCLFRGDLPQARKYIEQVLPYRIADLDVGRERRQASGDDAICRAAGYGALAAWHLADFSSIRSLIALATEIARDAGGTAPVVVATLSVIVETRREDPVAAVAAADRTVSMSTESGMAMFAGIGTICRSWATGRLHDPEKGARELRTALKNLVDTGAKFSVCHFHGLLADLEARAGNTVDALKDIAAGLELAADTGEHYTDPYLHCLRGSVLLKHDPSNTTAAEDAYRTAIAIADQQGARSYELLASLSLAKLYQSTGRPAEAHAVLAPALEGFSPTPEMPEIAEAQVLLASLAQTAEVEKASARRQSRRRQSLTTGRRLPP